MLHKKHHALFLFSLGILIGGAVFGLISQRKLLHQPRIGAIQRDTQAISSSFRSIIKDISGEESAGNIPRLKEILQVLEKNYYDKQKIHTGTMITNAIKAFVDAIDDPYTIYMDAVQNSGFQEELKGESDFEGIGAVVAKKEYFVQVEEVLKESPAFKVGILPLDRIVFVETGSVKDLTIGEAVAKIRGPKGTKVRLMLERLTSSGHKELLEKVVTRDKLSLPSVSHKILTGKNNTHIGLITISIIGEETEHLLQKTISEISPTQLSGVIIDLRGNGGGILPISVEIASHFIPEGKEVVSADYQTLGKEVFSSKGYGDLEHLPLVVLIDGMTASAGEIISLALKEQRGAKIIGTQSFGKGSIQTMEEFPDGASLKYTVGKRYSPSGKNIDKIGITPDISIEFNTTGYRETSLDNQLEKAKEVITHL